MSTPSRLVSMDMSARDSVYKGYRIARTFSGEFIVSKDGVRIYTAVSEAAARAAIDEIMGVA